VTCVGIRREDKNEWERRVPLSPSAVAKLTGEGLAVCIQPSDIRAFSAEEYTAVGASVQEDLSSCPIVFGVKEMPVDFLEQGKTYAYFSHTIKGQAYNMPMLQRLLDLKCQLLDYELVHTIKGQAYNMPMLQRLLDLKCQLLDYELVAEETGRRLLIFGRYAGLAGMIDALWALGRRLAWEGVASPFADVRRAFEYASLSEAKESIQQIGARITRDGLPAQVQPLVIGFAGYGNVSLGAQEILDLLPHTTVEPCRIGEVAAASKAPSEPILKVIFKEEDMVESVSPETGFDLQDYYDHPEKYRGRFESYLPHIHVLVNGIYWEPRYPRLVTKDWLRSAWAPGSRPRLKLIADIGCDIEGPIQCTVKATDPGNPVYVYHPVNESVTDGWEGPGVVVLAVDNLPCELPRDASEFFGDLLLPYVSRLARADYTAPFSKLDLPAELQRAFIVHQGTLTPAHTHLKEYL